METPDGRLIVCRTGYTGEDGFELFCEASHGVTWWDRAIAAGATPCGLGARDTLRLEMCYPLNGNDLSPDHSPLEAGLGFFVDMEKGDFTGRDLLASQKVHGLTHKLTAIRLADKSPPARAHYPVLSGGQSVGELCSGGVSPSMGCGIGMAYLSPELSVPGTKLEIDIRGRAWPAEVVKKPFYRRPASA
jgi:aminomethyltransferase